jgi:pimeloyl-ACP methyl ester carboxylesterase
LVCQQTGQYARTALQTHMDNVRTHGNAPFTVAVVHGGPGAPGELAPVARELAGNRGVLEPLQTESRLDGQVRELEAVLKRLANTPVALIGHSWGAMLSYILAAQSPSLVKRLILISSGVFEDKYAERITETRLSRLTKDEANTVRSLSMALDDSSATDKNRIFSGLASLLPRQTPSIRCPARAKSLNANTTSTSVSGKTPRRCAAAAGSWRWAGTSGARWWQFTGTMTHTPPQAWEPLSLVR